MTTSKSGYDSVVALSAVKGGIVGGVQFAPYRVSFTGVWRCQLLNLGVKKMAHQGLCVSMPKV